MGSKEELEKKWNKFLERLDCNDEFQFQLKSYLENIKDIAEITLESIDSDQKRTKINDRIGAIVKFIEEYSKETKDHAEYYEISQITGFWKMENIENDPDYYFYIADQKMKASVYYVRYLNFIERTGVEVDLKKAKEEAEKAKEDIEERERKERILAEKEMLYNAGNDIEYMIYMMFNNMMREIRFEGAAYQYLWHWEKKPKTLYRCSVEEKEALEGSGEPSSTKQGYIKAMFQKCIDHMNGTKNGLKSYSEHMLIDIYKYLNLKADSGECVIYSDDALKISGSHIKNNNKALFKILKNVYVNSIFDNENGKAMSFQEYVVDNSIDAAKQYPFAVEIMPPLEGEQNDKGTLKGMRDKYLPAYFRTWGITEEFSKAKVADDKEVITSGKCYKECKKIDGNCNGFQSYDDGTLFQIALDKEDIIYLLFEIRKKRFENDIYNTIQTIAERLTEGISINSTDIIKKYEDKEAFEFELHTRPLGDNKEDKFFKLTVEIKNAMYERDIFLNPDKGRRSIEEIKDPLRDLLKEKIFQWWEKRYEKICEDDNRKEKCAFIIDSFKSYGCKEFELVKKYNPYFSVSFDMDEEIVMLKEIIFNI